MEEMEKERKNREREEKERQERMEKIQNQFDTDAKDQHEQDKEAIAAARKKADNLGVKVNAPKPPAVAPVPPQQDARKIGAAVPDAGGNAKADPHAGGAGNEV